MQKIVINKCYGGFGLSTEGFEHYLKLKGIAYESQPSKWEWLEGDKDFYEAGHLGADAHYLSDRGIDRNDPALIQTVEDLGTKANDRYAKLTIIEIPDDVEWQVDEYDGNEWIAEKHRTWGD